MAWIPSTFVSRWGLTDPLKIALVQPVMDTALALAETYLDRKLLYAEEVAVFTHTHAKILQLNRYPLHAIVAMENQDGSGDVGTTHVIHQTGQIYLDTRAHGHQIKVQYQAGYKTLPPDLEFALSMIADAVWSSTPGGGKTIGATASPVSSQAIKSVSTPDVGTVTYFDPVASASAAASVGSSQFISSDTANLLAPYRRLDA